MNVLMALGALLILVIGFFWSRQLLIRTMVVCALVHLVILYLLAVAQGQYQLVNYFVILGVTHFVPSLAHGVVNWWLSQALAVAIFFAVRWYTLRQEARAKAD